MSFSIQQIFEQAQNDPSLMNTLRTDELLETIGAEDCPHLADKTLDEIAEEVVDSFLDLGVYSRTMIEKCCRSLLEYQYVDKIHLFQTGRLLRWLRIRPLETDETKVKVKSGAICTGVRFHNNGAYIQCVTANGKNFFQLKFDDYQFYQKMSAEELMILSINKYIVHKT